MTENPASGWPDARALPPLTAPDEHVRAVDLLSRRALQAAPLTLDAVLRVRSPEGVVGVRLTEVEAYEGADDPGSHAYRGRTARTAPMFGAAGSLYVYFTYGMHWCANLVCGPEGTASAVLLRAGEVVEGADLARERRAPGRIRRDADLARGPANLARCLGLSGPDSGLALDPRGRGALELGEADGAVERLTRVRRGPRVGVAGPGADAEAYPWRYTLDGEVTLSAYRAAVSRPRRREHRATLDRG